MKKLSTILILSLAVQFACKPNQENAKEDFFVIKYKDFDIDKDSTEIIVGVEFYHEYNIILFDSISDIYYHRKRWICRTGWGFNGNLPYFQFLQPKHFIKNDDLDSIKEIVLAGLLTADFIKERHFVCLIYNQDTIRDKRYFELKEFFQSNDIHVSTRKPTEEENEVLKSIMSGEKYDPNLIEWKKTFRGHWYN